MSGRIRSIKPEWLDDAKLCACTVEARLLSVALLLLADDYGNGRAHPAFIASHVFYGNPDPAAASGALGELEAIGYVVLYEVRGQNYFSIRNWAKHQRVDKPGKPRVPGPSDATSTAPQGSHSAAKSVYFLRGSVTGLIKIGESTDPVGRLVALAKGASEELQLLAVVANGSRTERELHQKLAAARVHGEWFMPTAEVIAELRACGGREDVVLARAGYDNGKRVLESVANDSRAVPESLAPDLRSGSPISDHGPGGGPTRETHPAPEGPEVAELVGPRHPSPPSGSVGHSLDAASTAVLAALEARAELRGVATEALAQRLASHCREHGHPGRWSLEQVLECIEQAATKLGDEQAGSGVAPPQGTVARVLAAFVRSGPKPPSRASPGRGGSPLRQQGAVQDYPVTVLE